MREDADNYEAYGKKPKSGSTVLMQVLFSHVGLSALNFIYLILGVYIFIQLELPNEQKRFEMKQAKAFDVNDTLNYYIAQFWYYQGQNYSFAAYNATVYNDIQTLEHYIISAVKNVLYDGTYNGWVWQWTFPNVFFFTFSIATTVGYGNIFPKTFFGQMFVILYAMVGVPLFLLFLANIGDSMGKSFTYVYSRMCCRWCRSRRYDSELPEGEEKKKVKLLTDDEVGKEEYMPTTLVQIPITISMVLMFMYIFLGGIIFGKSEGWNPFGSIYFCFVSLATIGYGDYLPSLDNSGGATAMIKPIWVMLYVVIGLAVVSMSLNLMQEQIIAKCRWFAGAVGLSNNTNVKTIKKEEEEE